MHADVAAMLRIATSKMINAMVGGGGEKTRRLVDGVEFSTAATWPLVFSDGPSESGRSARGGDFRSPFSSAGSSRENERLFIAVVCGFAQYTADADCDNPDSDHRSGFCLTRTFNESV